MAATRALDKVFDRAVADGARAIPEEVRRILRAELPSGAARHVDELENRRGTIGVGGSIYVSTPITTGRAYVTWRRGFSDRKPPLLKEREVRERLIRANEDALGPLVAELAARFGADRLIVPTDVEETHWSQENYHRFWLEVIDRFAIALVLADGWEFSTGCSYEFAFAVSKGLPIYDASLSSIEISDAAARLRAASSELRKAGLPTGANEAALEAALTSA